MMAKERPILMSGENMAQNEKPIIFLAEMVRAILENRKSQTRRAINPQPQYRPYLEEDAVFIKPSMYIAISNASALREHCPYGQVGDLLWVREGWRCTGGGDLRNIIYRVEGDSSLSFCGVDDGRAGILHVPEPHWAEWDRLVYKTNKGRNWRSPIHMYKWTARIWLEITGIRVERVQEISEEDAVAEGLKLLQGGILSEFAVLWNSIHKKEHRWSDNFWVWVIEFKKIERK